MPNSIAAQSGIQQRTGYWLFLAFATLWARRQCRRPGSLYAIDRTSKFAFVKLEEKANRKTASAFLEDLVEAVRYKIHTRQRHPVYLSAKI